jgi:lysophospholipase L1-like esterase
VKTAPLLLFATVLAASTAHADGTAVLIGDSIAAGAYATSYRQSYAQRLTSKLADRIRVVNYSRGGWSVAGVSPPFTEPANYEATLALWPSAYILALGTNDYSVSVPLASFGAAYASMLSTLGGFGSASVIVCVTPILRVGEETLNAAGATLADYRAVIMDECQVAGGVALDAADALTSPKYLTDGLHPGDQGHRKLARWLTKRLAPLWPAD